MMDFEEFNRRGLLRQIAAAFTNEQLSRAALRNIGFPLDRLPQFGPGFWDSVCADIAHGAVRGRLGALLDEAARLFPGHEDFTRHAAGTIPPPPQQQQQTAAAVSVQLVDCDDPTALVDAARAAAIRLQISVTIDIGYVLDATVCLHLGTSVENAVRIVTAATEGEAGLGRVVAAHPFADHVLEQLYVEGPDQGRFMLNQVPASTRTREIAKGTMSQYDDHMWPRDKHGRVRPSVVDHVKSDGTVERLPPDQTLHDSNVRNGDTLHVSPESTAGALHPRIREEALARVRAQILDYAAGHPDFDVFANAAHAPTEYTFRFRVPGWGPPVEPGAAPTPVDDHEVFLSLPPEFPMKAPAVFWRSPQFHPNIDPETGFVCLGELEDGYRPAMDFGVFCQLLVDLAAYRNYELSEGYNTEAGAWAGSVDGQLAIEQRGGRSKLREAAEALDELSPAVPLRIERVRP